MGRALRFAVAYDSLALGAGLSALLGIWWRARSFGSTHKLAGTLTRPALSPAPESPQRRPPRPVWEAFSR